MQILFRNIFQDLKDAVQDWVTNDGGNPVGLYIVTFSGLAIDLNDIPIPTIDDFTGFRITIGAYTIDIPNVAVGLINPSITIPTLVIAGLDMNFKVPGSENWKYGGPLRENVWPPVVGTSPSFSATQYYNGIDGIIDGAGLSVVIGFAYALNKVGLSKISNYFMSRIMTRGSISAAHDIFTILKNTDDIIIATSNINNAVNTIDGKIGTGAPSLTSSLASLSGIAAAINAIVETVEIELLTGEGNPDTINTKLNNIMEELGLTELDPDKLNSKVDELLYRLKPKTYV